MGQLYARVGNAWVPTSGSPVPGAWIPVTTFLNGWVSYGLQAPQYRKVGDIVYLRGALKSGTLAAVAFVLPVGYRPLTALYIGTLTAGPTYGYYTIDTVGNVTPQTGNAAQYELAYDFSTLP
jgi:hypothetical protein